MLRYTQDDLITALNHIEWKAILQLIDEMADAKGVPRKFWPRLFGEPSFDWMYTQLDRLIEQEIVEWRLGTDEEKLSNRARRRYKEFRLSANGLRRKDEIIERNRKTQRVGGLAQRPI